VVPLAGSVRLESLTYMKFHSSLRSPVMRFLSVAMLVGLIALVNAGQSFADKIEVKGPHICCPQCVKAVEKILGELKGVSDITADSKTKTVTFTAKDAAAATDGVNALIKGGFSGKATSDGKEMEVKLSSTKDLGKADKVVVKDVHVCCGACQTAIKNLFKDSKVSFENKGPQRTVNIEGTNLDRGAVLDALRKAGFNGTAEK
jgi:copper chaperone CopZ